MNVIGSPNKYDAIKLVKEYPQVFFFTKSL